MHPDQRTMAHYKAGCICKGVKLIRLMQAIEQGATTFAEVAAQTGIGNGPCHGKRCQKKVAQLLAEQVDPLS